MAMPGALTVRAFLRHSETDRQIAYQMKLGILQRSQRPFPKSPRLHSRSVRSYFRNERSILRQIITQLDTFNRTEFVAAF